MTRRRPDKTRDWLPVERALDRGIRLDLLLDERVDGLPNQRRNVGLS